MPETKDVPEWTYEHPADHPDNNPPVTAVAVPSDEEKQKYEDSINAQIKKALPTGDELTPFKAKSEKVDYDAKTVDELKDLARERGIDVSWDARKADLVKALEKHDKKG